MLSKSQGVKVRKKINEKLAKELVGIQKFLKKKGITLTQLAKEMEYDRAHIVRVFHANDKATEKFLIKLGRAIERILFQDLLKFYDIINESHEFIHTVGFEPTSCFTSAFLDVMGSDIKKIFSPYSTEKRKRDP